MPTKVKVSGFTVKSKRQFDTLLDCLAKEPLKPISAASYRNCLKRVYAGIKSGELDDTLIFVRMPHGGFGAIVNASKAKPQKKSKRKGAKR